MKLNIPGLAHLVGSRNIVKDQLRRQIVQAYEVDRALCKAIVSDLSLAVPVRQQVQRLFETELPRDSAAGRLRNRCALTGRARGVYSKFRLSRIMFRQMASRGMLNGVRKASW